MNCTRCHRPMKAQTDTGMGPKCALAMLGRKPEMPRRVSAKVERDERTPDLFGHRG